MPPRFDRLGQFLFCYLLSSIQTFHTVDKQPDDREKCTFFFPALVREGPLTVGISTDGKSPLAASWVRREIAGMLPESIGEIIDLLGQIRPAVMALEAEESDRKKWFEQILHPKSALLKTKGACRVLLQQLPLRPHTCLYVRRNHRQFRLEGAVRGLHGRKAPLSAAGRAGQRFLRGGSEGINIAACVKL